MHQAIKQCEEIKKYRLAIQKTASPNLKYQYGKRVNQLEKELKQYCKFKGLNYRILMKNYG